MRTIIIGGTAAGMSAAAKLRRVDSTAEIYVYEKRSYVSFGACGLPYYVGDFFDDTNQMIARSVEKTRESGIHVFTKHEVTKVDALKKVVLVTNHETGESFEVEYDKLMVATGAIPMIPSIEGVELKQVYTLHSMSDGIELKKAMQSNTLNRVAIIGAGFIGLEVVEAALEYGKEVHVFQKGDRILNHPFDKEITDLLEKELREKRVHLHLDSSVTKIIGTDAVEGVACKEEITPVDMVVLAIGVKPNTEFLDELGLTMFPNGAIVVDCKGRTSVEDIYAAGDCATVPHKFYPETAYIPLATTANKLGRVVGENLGGLDTSFQPTLGSSCIKVLDMHAGVTGLTEVQASKLGIPYGTSFVTDMNQTSYYPGQEPIHVKLIYHAETGVLLGGQVVGKKDAVQRVDVLAAAIQCEMTTAQLGMLDLCYSPPFARTWDVLNIAGNASKLKPKQC